MAQVNTLGLDPKRIRRWRRDIWRAFQREFKPTEIPAIMVLVAIREFGTDLSVLSAVTGSSEAYVRKVLRRLRKERVVSGQSMRTAKWDDTDDMHAHVAIMLDAGVAAGIFARGVSPTRSAAQKARARETRHRGPRRRTALTPGAVFSPKMVKSDPLYGLPEWSKNETTGDD